MKHIITSNKCSCRPTVDVRLPRNVENEDKTDIADTCQCQLDRSDRSRLHPQLQQQSSVNYTPSSLPPLGQQPAAKVVFLVKKMAIKLFQKF